MLKKECGLRRNSTAMSVPGKELGSGAEFKLSGVNWTVVSSVSFSTRARLKVAVTERMDSASRSIILRKKMSGNCSL